MYDRPRYDLLMTRVAVGDGCWEWIGRRRSDGRGEVGRHGLAYRALYEAVYGPLPRGHGALHRCNNPSCVKVIGDPAVDHIYAGTQGDNTQDAIRAGTYREPPHLRGEAHPHAKIDDAQVAALRKRYAAGGVTFAELGREYGMSGRGVSYIIHGRYRLTGTVEK